MFNTKHNGGYKCQRDAATCHYDHRHVSHDELMTRRPPNAVIEEYRKGNGKGGKGWVDFMKKLIDAQDARKGKDGGKGKGKGKSKGSGGDGKITPRTMEKAKAQLAATAAADKSASTAPPALTKKQVQENVAFAATGRFTCNKAKCEDANCHQTKNHRNWPALPSLFAATHGDAVPATYGKTRKAKADGVVDEDGFTAVGGEFVVAPPPPPYVQPAPFGEDDEDEE